MAFLHLLFVAANSYIQFKQPIGPGRIASNRLTIVQGLLEISAFICLAAGEYLGPLVLVLLSCMVSLLNAFLLRRALATIKEMKPLVIEASSLTEKREESSNIHLDGNPRQ